MTTSDGSFDDDDLGGEILNGTFKKKRFRKTNRETEDHNKWLDKRL
ncbi:hypothetical protein BCM0074_p319 (plasmid) [Bacillus cereus]|nr:hypothetical protein BCM0074_p319 [Bacillus cereus]